MDQNKQILDILYGRLSEYIIDHLKYEVNKSGFFKCPTGTHADQSPSCHIVKYNPQVAKCFGCNRAFNIFGFAHLAEGLPLEGPDFWNITVKRLCEIFKIEYSPTELDQLTKERYKKLRAYRDAVDIIANYPEDETALIYKYLKERGWSIEIAKEFEIGVVESIEAFTKEMLSKGWTKDYLQTVELQNKNLFNKNNLLFIVKDENNHPVGFAARKMTWKKGEDESSPKYLNSLTSDIYKKGSILFGFEKAKIFTPPLWIVEGYGDCVKLHECGMKNVAAVGSTSLTAEHLVLLRENKIKDIVLMFDNDEGGRIGVNRALSIFNENRDFNVRILKLPDGIVDPDDFLKEKGIDELKKLIPQSPFDYKLSGYSFDADHAQICKEMIEIIAGEKSPINQYKMVKTLSIRTEYPENIIFDELKMITGDTDFQKYTEFKDRQNALTVDIRKTKNLNDLYAKLEVHKSEVESIVDSYNLSKPEIEEYKQRLEELKHGCETEQDPGFSFGSFKIMEEALEGLTKQASMIGLAGISNIGKTSFLRHLLLELAINNKNLVVLFMSIDDSFRKIVCASVALMSDLHINDIAKARKRIWKDEEKKNIYFESWKKYSAISDRFIVKDATEGNTTLTLEKHIKYYKKLYPDKDMIVALDNFHKLTDFGGSPERYTELSNRVKKLTTTYNIPLIMTLELRKGAEFGERPTLYDVKESVDIQYDCDMIMLMHQELHVDPNTRRVWYHDGIRMPYNEIDVAKNKEGSFKGTLYFKFLTHSSKFFESTEHEFHGTYAREKTRPNEQESRPVVQDDQPSPELFSKPKVTEDW